MAYNGGYYELESLGHVGAGKPMGVFLGMEHDPVVVSEKD